MHRISECVDSIFVVVVYFIHFYFETVTNVPSKLSNSVPMVVIINCFLLEKATLKVNSLWAKIGLIK